MNNEQRRQQLAEQIQRRLEILAQWSEAGVPDGYSVPNSLTKIRMWKDSELRLSPIRSPGSFTKTHEAHGELVRKIDGFRKGLLAPSKPKRKPKASATKLLRNERQRTNGLTAAVTNAADQYVSLRVKFDDVCRKLKVEKQAREDAEQVIDHQWQAMRELKSELVRLRASAGDSNITSIKFGKD